MYKQGRPCIYAITRTHRFFIERNFFNYECNFRTNFLGGGYRYSLKCVEKGTISGGASKTFTSTYGGELRLCLGDYYPSTLVIDGVNMGQGNVLDVFLSATNGSSRVFTIPFSTSVQVTARSAYEGYVEEYVLYTYQRIAETT